jgi:pyruvate,water dikinase
VRLMVLDRLIRFFRRDESADLGKFRTLFERFQQILTGNNRILELISELEDKLSGEYIFDINYVKVTTQNLSEEVHRIISNLNIITDGKHPELFSCQDRIEDELENIVEDRPGISDEKYIIDFNYVDSDNAAFVGGKNANLGEIRNRIEMSVPDGFVITVASYRRFMEYNDLWPKIRSIYDARQGKDKKSGEEYDRTIDDLFTDARVPPDVVRALSRHVNALCKRKKRKFGVAVRSSAYGEDSEKRSFAGQFKSFLHCKTDDIPVAYVKVIASRFKNTIAVYGGERIVEEDELPMAVGVQETIPASVAGVVYSVDPSGESLNSITISACFGLGVHVVEGTVNADYFEVSRLDPTEITNRRIGKKKTKLVLAEPQGTKSVPLPEDQQTQSSLTDEQVVVLAKTALLLDRYFKRPVDVEWCFDDRGELYILQCRPLRLPAKPRARAADLTGLLAKKPVVMRKKGMVAQRGIAVGKIWHVEEDEDPDDFPVGAIAVTKYTTPRLTSIIRKAAAIITDVGGSSGHMATVAREFGVPMIVNTEDATTILADGEEVTLDAEENIVYKGIVTELLEYDMEAEDVFRDLKEYQMLRRLLRRITPLNLIDPTSADFSAKNCRTYHDIVRFAHEKAVQCLINLNISSRRFRGIKSKQLKLPIPLGLSLIDLGGGLRDAANVNKIESVDLIESAPLKAVLAGLLAPGIWSTQPSQLGFGDLVSSMTRYKMTDRISEYQGANLAVISECYMNMSLRLGYHFNVIDTYLSENAGDNYIYFRFVGGVTENERRHLRALAIKEILSKLNFKVTVTGDLVVARLKQWEAKEIARVLEEMGRLIGFTRQLDTRMQSEESIQECYRAFFDDRRES